MKSFDSFSKAFNYIENNLKKSTEKALETITEQIYKDSREFTYLDSDTMYKSGLTNSDFKNGIIILRSPYVRIRYYVDARGKKNKKARIKWFDATKRKHIKTYKKMLAQAIGGK